MSEWTQNYSLASSSFWNWYKHYAKSDFLTKEPLNLDKFGKLFSSLANISIEYIMGLPLVSTLIDLK